MWGISHLPFSAASGGREAVPVRRGADEQGRHDHVARRGALSEDQRLLARCGEVKPRADPLADLRPQVERRVSAPPSWA